MKKKNPKEVIDIKFECSGYLTIENELLYNNDFIQWNVNVNFQLYVKKSSALKYILPFDLARRQIMFVLNHHEQFVLLLFIMSKTIV